MVLRVSICGAQQQQFGCNWSYFVLRIDFLQFFFYFIELYFVVFVLLSNDLWVSLDCFSDSVWYLLALPLLCLRERSSFWLFCASVAAGLSEE
jgi:hypothetical protein